MLAVILVSGFCCWSHSCTYSFWDFSFQKKVLLKEVTVVVPIVLFWRRFSSICVLVKIAQHSNWEYFWRQRRGQILRDVDFPENVYPALKWSELNTANNAGSAFWLFYIFHYGYASKCVHVFPWWVLENLTMIERFILDAQILVKMMSGWHTGHQITNKSLIHSSCYMSNYNWRGLGGGGGVKLKELRR